ncbi:hypothetical protein FUAX_25410 [Fulvitalea axinellae]|uniref:Cytochrome b561 bacterial/Ni-hydrogenase domain-containing protein n=1 Tax=Fulvitalea axinellae TaxID=1182444 RepID=A0AAU9CDD0_9BACT|nr:hypothetical protein FUAX_25410 [Fulvitalea axinellae]
MKNNTNRLGATYRIWHWVNGVAVLGLLGTVILRKTFLSWRTNSAVIQDKLSEFGVTADAAKATAKTIRAPMWEWHYIFGFIATGALVIRLIQIIAKKDTSSLAPAKKVSSGGKDAFVRLSYIAFYIMLGVMAVTGIALYYSDSFGLTGDFKHDIKEFHEALMWFFAIFTPVHLLGVFLSELTDKPGIISRMINGKGQKTEKPVEETEIV